MIIDLKAAITQTKPKKETVIVQNFLSGTIYYQGGKCLRGKIDSREMDKWSRRRAVIAKLRGMNDSRTELRGRPNRIAGKYGRF